MTSFTCSSRQARTQRVHWMQASRLTHIAGCDASVAGCRRASKRGLPTPSRSLQKAELVLVRLEIRLGRVRLQQLEHHLLRVHGARRDAGDLHVLGGTAAARGCQHALALDLHHARPAVAVGAQAFLVAEVRDAHAVALGGLEDGLARERRDGLAVQLELDVSVHPRVLDREPERGCRESRAFRVIRSSVVHASPRAGNA